MYINRTEAQRGFSSSLLDHLRAKVDASIYLLLILCIVAEESWGRPLLRFFLGQGGKSLPLFFHFRNGGRRGCCEFNTPL